MTYGTLNFRMSRAAIGFTNGNPTGEGYKVWSSQPEEPFRPVGLMIWGATALTRIHAIKVGNKRQHIISRETCPGRLFAAPLGFVFQDFIKLFKDKPDDGAFLEHWHYFNNLLTEHPDAQPSQLVGLDTATLGSRITVEYVGPMTDLAMWGFCKG